MNININLFEIKNNTELDTWGQRLTSDLLEEARLTLQEEGVTRETALTFTIGDRKFLIGVMIAPGEIKAANPDRDINQMHRQIFLSNKLGKAHLTPIYDIAAE